MTKKELRELIRSTIKEYTGTGDGKGNSTDGNNIKSQRPFVGAQDELNVYNDQGAPFGGAEGQHTRGMEKNKGSFNRHPNTRF